MTILELVDQFNKIEGYVLKASLSREAIKEHKRQRKNIVSEARSKMGFNTQKETIEFLNFYHI